jgi:hypothetical protein
MFNSNIEFINCSFIVVIGSSNQTSLMIDLVLIIAFSAVVIDSFFVIASIRSFFCLFKSSFQESFCVVVIVAVYFEFNNFIIISVYLTILAIVF